MHPAKAFRLQACFFSIARMSNAWQLPSSRRARLPQSQGRAVGTVATSITDCIVIGAGASGISAARVVKNSGKSVLVIEAKERIGGRVVTDVKFINFPFDLGAEFIHGDGAAIHQLACEAGFDAIPVDRFGKMWWADSNQKACYWEDHPSVDTIKKLWDDKHDLERANLEPDVSLATYLKRRGRTDQQIEAGDVLLAQTMAAPATSLSSQDLAHEMRVDAAGDGESRLTKGYGPLLEWMAQGLDIRTSCPVSSITQLPDGSVAVEAAGGARFTARTCIITVPITILQRRSISFSPALPEDKLEAVDSMRMEPASKLIYHFRRYLWPKDLTYMCHTGLAARWWTPGYHREGAEPLICSYITADRARVVDGMSDEEALEAGLQELAVLLGQDAAAMRRELVKGRVVRWSREEHIWGGYAYCPTGAAAARKVLAAPTWAGRLLFAGEATAFGTNPQTVHGAIESGERAARQALASFTLRSKL